MPQPLITTNQTTAKGDVRRSLRFTFLDRYVTVAIQFMASIAIARLLTPEDIGIYSVGAVLVGLVHVIRDFGVTNYLLQEKDLSSEKIRVAFTATLMISWILSFTLFLCAGGLSAFYDEPGLRQVIWVMSVSFLLIPFGAPVLALLRRDMRFDTLCWINLASAVTNNFTTVGLAVGGAGFMSLAWGGLAGVITTTLLAILSRPRDMPVGASLHGLGDVLRFGGKASAANVLSEAGLGATDLVVGKLVGFGAVGYYSRAWGFVSLFNYAVSAAIQPVVHSRLAETNRSGRRLVDDYVRALSLIMPLAWTFYGFAGLMAAPALYLLYGSQWDASVPVLQILCVAFALRALTVFSGQAFLATGAVGTLLLFQSILQPIRIALTIVAALHGLLAVAWVQVIFYALTLFLTHGLLHARMGLTMIGLRRELRSSCLVSFIALTPVSIMVAVIPTTRDDFHALFIGGIFTAGALIGALHFTRHPLSEELKVITRLLFSAWHTLRAKHSARRARK